MKWPEAIVYSVFWICLTIVLLYAIAHELLK